jgi:hypothetical protein
MKNISTSSRPQSFFYFLAAGILIMHIPGFPSVLRTSVTVLLALVIIFLTYQVFSNKKAEIPAEKKAEVIDEPVVKVAAEAETETEAEAEVLAAVSTEEQGESKSEQQNV